MAFKITNQDALWVAAGGAVNSLMSWQAHRLVGKPDTDAQTTTLMTTAIVAIPTLAMAYTGLNDPGQTMNRNLAAFLFGLGTSRALSYGMSLIDIGSKV